MTPRSWPERLGGFGLGVLLLFFQMNATVAWVGLGFIILAFLLEAPATLRRLAGNPLIPLWLALLAYIAASTALAAKAFPDTADEQWKSLRLWYGILFFMPVVACYMERGTMNLPRVLLFAGGSVVLRIVTHFDDTNPFVGERVGFGLNPIATALYMEVCALGLLVLAPRLLEATVAPPWLKSLTRILGPILLLLFLEALVLSQSRSGWVAAGLVFPPILLLRYRRALAALNWRAPRTLATVALLLAGLGLFVRENAEIIGRRLPANVAGVEHAIKGEKAEEADTSIGFRLLMWQVGLERWLERPLTGWGPGSTEMLLTQSKVAMLHRKSGKSLFSHLHNTYLEVLLKFGLVGAGLFGALGAGFLLALWRGWQAGLLAADLAWLLLGIWGLSLVWSFFEFRFFHYEWRNYCMLLGAVSFSLSSRLRHRQPTFWRPHPAGQDCARPL